MHSLYYIVQYFEIMLIKQLSISYCSNFFYNCQGVVAKQVILCKVSFIESSNLFTQKRNQPSEFPSSGG